MNINRIAKAIEDVFGVSPLERPAEKELKVEYLNAQRIFCYILKYDYDSILMASRAINKQLSLCEISAESILNKVKLGDEIIRPINKVKKELGLPKALSDKAKRIRELKRQRIIREQKERSRRNAKRLFGIEYTSEDETRMQRAIEESNEYFKKMSRIGRSPLQDGMVFTANTRHKRIKWYSEL